MTAVAVYVDISYGNDYFARRLFTSSWDNACDTDRQKAIYQATEIIDQLNYVGDKTDADQDLQFPRGGDTEYPDAIKRACCLIAMALLDGADPEMEASSMYMTSNRFDSVRTTYDPSTVAGYTASGVPSFEAWKLIFPFLTDFAAINLRRVN